MSVLWIAPLLALGGTPDAGADAGRMAAVAADWGAMRTPLHAPAAALGGYSAGCLQGAVPLPPSGPGYEVLHLGRNRRFGHPMLVDFIRQLGAAIKKKKLGMLLVGDMSQPRGGPTPTGHKSHQTGLDVDLGYAFPPWAVRRHPTAAERESLMPPAVVDLTAGKLTELWQPRVATVLELAAADPAVDRIFVHPIIKRELCARAKPPTAPSSSVPSSTPRSAPSSAWLRKLRPWWGHHDHFHVRLRCPAASEGCEAQEPLPADDGCAKLGWWFSEDARKTREKRAAESAAGPPPLPARCQEVLAGK
jgi:penicillin-insensitive murein endopeptidase